MLKQLYHWLKTTFLSSDETSLFHLSLTDLMLALFITVLAYGFICAFAGLLTHV